MLFLDRRLWPEMAAALRPGGLLVFETFVDLPGGRTSEVGPEHLLQPGELRAAFEALGLEPLLLRRGRPARDGPPARASGVTA